MCTWVGELEGLTVSQSHSLSVEGRWYDDELRWRVRSAPRKIFRGALPPSPPVPPGGLLRGGPCWEQSWRSTRSLLPEGCSAVRWSGVEWDSSDGMGKLESCRSSGGSNQLLHQASVPRSLIVAAAQKRRENFPGGAAPLTPRPSGRAPPGRPLRGASAERCSRSACVLFDTTISTCATRGRGRGPRTLLAKLSTAPGIWDRGT